MLVVHDLLLLSFDDDDGSSAIPFPVINQVSAGAVLFDLVLAGRVEVDGTATPQTAQFRVLDRAPTGQAVLDDALAIVAHDEPATAATLIKSLSKNLHERVRQDLTAAGMLVETEHKVLGLINRPPVDRRRPRLRAGPALADLRPHAEQGPRPAGPVPRRPRRCPARPAGRSRRPPARHRSRRHRPRDGRDPSDRRDHPGGRRHHHRRPGGHQARRFATAAAASAGGTTAATSGGG